MARNCNEGGTRTTDRIDYANVWNPADQAQTIAFWIYPTQFNAAEYYFACHETGDGALGGILVWDDFLGGQLAFSAIRGNASTNTYRSGDNTSLSTGSWQHVFITWDGSTTSTNIHIFVDGVEVTYNDNGDGSGTVDAGTGSHSINGRIFDDTRNADARYAAFGWWNRVLSAAEMGILTNGFSPLFIPNGLLFAPDLIRDIRDPISGKAGTNDGSVVVPHPRIIHPIAPYLIPTAAAAAPSGSAVPIIMAHQRRMRS